VEPLRPLAGELDRVWLIAQAVSEGRLDSATFQRNNLNKRSICINFTRPEGQQLARGLACLEITDRTKVTHIVGDFNVYPGDTEGILVGQLRTGARSQSSAVPDDHLGEMGGAVFVLRPVPATWCPQLRTAARDQ
jgi:acyl-CoA synthetase (AMP-forming)/AMP-acid ligase II